MAQATTATENTVTISDVGPSRKKITIEIPAETVSAKMTDSLDTLAVEAALPGFRKGRAPKRLIEKRFGTTLRSEAKQQMVAEAYSKAVEAHKLEVISEPSSETLDKVEIQEGKPLVFEIEVEVLPEFALPELKGIKVYKPRLEIGDDRVAKELERLCITEGNLEEREACEPGDYLTGQARMELPDGTEFYNINGAVVQAPTADKEGRGMILGIMVEDFAKQLGLPKAGDEVAIKAKGPQNHEIERLRGADLKMTFKVDRVDRIIPAEAATIALGFGFPSVDALKSEIKNRLQGRVAVEQQSMMRNQVAKNLVDATEMALPEKMAANQTERNLHRRRMDLMYRGIDAQHIEEQISDLRNSSHEVAVRELKLYFILHRAAEQMKVQVTEGDVNARIAQMAAQRNERPEKLRQELITSNQIGNVFQQIREHKALDAVLAQAVVEEVSQEEFEKKFADEG
ncbi:MAG: trigger factor [Phycisphaerales bacterium]|nr:trigger factor [Phycisphaerales bacterium]